MKVELKENPIHELMRKTLDKMYGDAIEITAAFNAQYIPMDTLWEVLHKNRFQEGIDLPIIKAESWDKIMDNIYIASKRYCNENKLEDRLPMIIFKTYIDVVKDNLG